MTELAELIKNGAELAKAGLIAKIDGVLDALTPELIAEFPKVNSYLQDARALLVMREDARGIEWLNPVIENSLAMLDGLKAYLAGLSEDEGLDG